MKQFKLPVCPYCGKQLSFFRSFLLHQQGEYQCPHCKRRSNVRLRKQMYQFAAIACGISVVLVALFLILNQPFFLSSLLVLLPFLFFYGSSPFLLVLVPLKIPQTSGNGPSGQRRAKPSEDLNKTRAFQRPQVPPSPIPNKTQHVPSPQRPQGTPGMRVPGEKGAPTQMGSQRTGMRPMKASGQNQTSPQLRRNSPGQRTTSPSRSQEKPTLDQETRDILDDFITRYPNE